MNVNEKYDFFVTVGAVTTQVFPAIDDLTIQWQKEDAEEFYRQSISSSLVFINNPKLSIDDYDYFKAIEDSSERCEEIVIEIYSKCQTPSVLAFTGLLIMTKAQWDEDRCVVTIPVTTNDEYTCLIANQDELIDFNGITPTVTARNFIGAIAQYNEVNETGTLLGPNYMPLPQLELALLNYQTTYDSGGNLVLEQWSWVREEDGTGPQPPGEGWVLDSGTWVRKVEMRFIEQTFDPILGDELIRYEVKGRSDFEADNGRFLSDVIEFIISSNCPYLSVVSNFLDINPDGTAPANLPYAAANTYLSFLVLWQKSDIKRFGDANNATKLRISWADLYESLKNLFNLRYVVDGVTLRIEHLSYFTETNGLDLTTQKAEYLPGTRFYTYDDSNYTNVEKFEQMDFVSPSFNGLDILYNSSCVDPEKRAITYRSKLITTDLDFCLDYPNDVDDDGFFLGNVALFNGLYYIQKNIVPAFSSLGAQFNGHLAYPNLHEFYWRHGRVFLSGEMNGAATTFATQIRSKAQRTINFKMCCDELLTFDVTELMNSQYGWGKIERASYSTKREELVIDLKHLP